MGPDPAVATVRRAVRAVLAELPVGGMVLAACSGGADSLALAGALAFEATRSGHQAGGITVDHGLQEGSAERADEVVRTLRGLGLDPAGSVAVKVDGPGGPEAAARAARYTALDASALRLEATVLLGHTLDDQAETVLLGLGRGSGARSLAGMPAAFERGSPRPGGVIRYRRPLLGLDRATVRRAALAMGLSPWDDPHNGDPSYTRVRVRREALPALERTLGPGVAEALARTARLLRDDADALDAWAATVREPDVAALAALPRAVRTRVLRRLAIEAGGSPGGLAAIHVDEMDRLVTAWHGQRHVDLPGGVRAFRRYGKLLFGPSGSR
ncbi:MAG: tRNA(Ile)-lysidine synthase [Streptosporangiaceae bacterium]|nr:tRNA(Ile)-lysidine synthetase [Streptosporangiaceae bacterium]MDX6432660.1 tRNA(Ile)-lysidine synthase [Streptosporangiaceae bacterium]